jgi:hypothetical protein
MNKPRRRRCKHGKPIPSVARKAALRGRKDALEKLAKFVARIAPRD